MSTVVWHGSHAYARCADCESLVRLNKPVVGSLHICLTDCEVAKRHLDVQSRRVGPFWARRAERYCTSCHRVVA